MTERYFLPVSSGLLEPKHVAAIGPAIWVFLWMVNKITRDEEGEGIVLNGAAIRSQVIAEDLGFKDRSVRTHLDILCDGGYIRKERCGHVSNGFRYWVAKSKKWNKSIGENQPIDRLLAKKRHSIGENLRSIGENRPHPHTPLKEKHTGTYINPVPPEPDIDHTMVARAVLETLRLSGQELLRNLSEVAKAELQAGTDAEKLVVSMCAAWEEYSKTPLKWHVGAAKFFGDGLWKNKALWAWMDGKTPTEAKPARRYFTGEAK